MQKSLKTILEIQELDMQMIQLMDLKRARQRDLQNIHDLKSDLETQSEEKDAQILELKKNSRLMEGEIKEVVEKLKKLETQQSSIKKVDEFNALSQEMSQTDRDKAAKEQRLSDLLDRLASEEDALKVIKQELSKTNESSKVLEAEIHDGIGRINEEGRVLKTQRDKLVNLAEPEVFAVYERLLRNKKDRVVVPIENRCCSGCHIMLTAQDENLVRRGERIIFCEHCSRIHYWPESQAVEAAEEAPKTRRRRPSKV